ncbi:MAG: GrpB family protein [Anaerolineales bacterium]
MPSIVELHPYNPNWAAMYQSEEAILKPIIGDQLVTIEHIGSTSIPGIKAKPIIDILIVVLDIDSIQRLIPAMETIGYQHRGELGISGRQYFRKDTDSVRSHHVHIYQQGHEAITKHLNFRDYLRTHPARAQAYSQLKEGLAAKYREDRAAYTDAKTEFIEETNQLAAAWREGKIAD